VDEGRALGFRHELDHPAASGEVHDRENIGRCLMTEIILAQ
jgi:hypothetical protein